MNDRSDAQLLRDYARHGDEAAFREIVRRHTNLVYSSALRQLRSPDLACDAVQSVFCDLACKAKPLAQSLGEEASLLGWLYRGTRFAALKQLRGDQRRQARERQVMEQFDLASTSAPQWESVRPLLDEAMADLSDDDREALLLRFFQERDFRAVGTALGVSEDAAQKRVSRALDRLRVELSHRGVTTTAVALAATVSANAVSVAPAGLAASAAGAALASTVAISTGPTLLVKLMTATKIKAALGIAVLAGLTVPLIIQREANAELRSQVSELSRQLATANAPAPKADEPDPVPGQNTNPAATPAVPAPELLRLRGEVGVLRQQLAEASAKNAGSRNQALGVQTILNQKNDEIAEKETVEAMNQVGWVCKLYSDSHRDEWPTNIAQVTAVLRPQVRTVLERFEFFLDRGIDPSQPFQVVARERTARHLPDGRWARIYLYADASAHNFFSEDGNFERYEKPPTSDSGQ